MTILRLLIAALLLSLVACAATPPASSEPIIYVMRHLHTPEGVADPDLTAEGRRHAGLLAEWFTGRPAPTAIYISDYRRTRQTAAPIAARLGLEPILYDPRNTPALVARLRSHRGNALIIGHSNTVPGIVEALGGERPAAMTHENFGDVWTVRFGTTERDRLDR